MLHAQSASHLPAEQTLQALHRVARKRGLYGLQLDFAALLQS